MKTKAIVTFILLLAGCSKTSSNVKVTANENGYSPSSVTIAKGQPASIEFVRTTDKTCAREVVFPDLNIKKDLPLNTPVTVTLPAGEAKTYTFQCGMAMYKGSVVVQ
jgi:plastocyanin domain-containing protein